MPEPASRYFAIVPAAGLGTRFGGRLPKQYLEIGGRSVLQWAVTALARTGWIEAVYVVVAPGDTRAAGLLAGLARVQVIAAGGASRRDTVLNTLRRLDRVAAHDWVLVHDAARPGLDQAALERLRTEVAGSDAGGLLALPVNDTVKRAGPAGEVAATLPRDGLWLAQTPQMFRRGPLESALARHPDVTDEAGAMEAEGCAVRLVRGGLANFKLTRPEDLSLLTRLLADGPSAGEHVR